MVLLRGCVFWRDGSSDAARGALTYVLSAGGRQLSGEAEAPLAEQLLHPSMCHLAELYVPSSKPWKRLLFGSCLTFLKSEGTGSLDPLTTPFPSPFQLQPDAPGACSAFHEAQTSLSFTSCSSLAALQSER